MNLENQNILFICRGTQHGGTENVVLQLCDIFIPLVKKVVVISGTTDGSFLDSLSALNVKHYRVSDIEDKSPKTITNTILTVKKIVIGENISVIHTHHRMAAFYVHMLGLDKKCTFINTSHNTFNNRKMMTRFAYKNCNLIACGKMVKKNLQEVYGLQNITVIHNAVRSFDATSANEELQFVELKKKGCILIGNVGRLSKQKGMKYFIQAVPAIVRQIPKARFYIIGSGEEEHNLHMLSKKLGIEQYIVFMGYRTDVQNLMRQLDLIVLSSLWEGLPLTPIEAFSVGKTIVATGVDGTIEIVRNGENGLLVDAKNSKHIAEKVIWMVKNPEEKKRMEHCALLTFKNDFSFEKLKSDYINYYKKL